MEPKKNNCSGWTTVVVVLLVIAVGVGIGITLYAFVFPPSAKSSCACIEDTCLIGETTCIIRDEVYINLANREIRKYSIPERNVSELLLDITEGVKTFDLYNGDFVYATLDPKESLLCTGDDCKLSEITVDWDVSGLAVDNATGDVYVADEKHGQVNVVNFKKGSPKVLLDQLDGPKNVALDLESKVIFIQVASAVLQFNVTNGTQEVIFDGSEVSGIAVNSRTKRLYIASSSTVVCIDYGAEKRFGVTELKKGQISQLVVLNSNLFAIVTEDLINRSIQRCVLDNEVENCEFEPVYRSNFISDIKSVMKNYKAL